MEAEREPSGVTRGQNVVQVVPHDWTAVNELLAQQTEKVDGSQTDCQILVITPDAESAIAAVDALLHGSGTPSLTALAVTSSARAARLLRAAPSQIVAGSPNDLAGLLSSSSLKLGSVRVVIFGWLDSILGTSEADSLETVVAELPKDSVRLVLASSMNEKHEALIERYARRARRVNEVSADLATPFNAEFALVTPQSRLAVLRRLLDAIDLPRADIYARTPQIVQQVQALVRTLGYSAEDIRVVSETAAPSPDALVLIELPTSATEFSALAGTTARKIYALVQGAQLENFRSMLAGGAGTPIALLEAAERARGKDNAMRAALREVLSTADVRREILALEPLLVEHEALEIAAAALHLLEQQRPVRSTSPVPTLGPAQKLFINVGEQDGVRPQDITMLAAQAGVPASQIGRIEVRESHSIVEFAAAVADLAAEKLTGMTVRGRAVIARIDVPREKPAGPRDRSGPPRDRSGAPRDRSGPPRDRSGPPERSGSRERGGARPPARFGGDDRPARPARTFDRGDRPAKPFDRSERPARPFDRGDRPAKPFDRGDRPDRPSGRSTGPRKFTRDAEPGRPRRPRDE